MIWRLEILGLPRPAAARLQAEARVLAALNGAARRIPAVRLGFTDENGPKGGRAMRCAITVTLPPRGRIHVEDRGTTTRLALDGAIAKLERRLGRLRGIEREMSRRPKKYHAAARAREA
jgi:ribosome-associated translation inhibitor RaiA